jgi:hypothetical protein
VNVEVNNLAVLLAALSSFVVGFVWYAKPVFGETWMKMVGMTDKKAQAGMGRAMMWSLIASLLTAYVLAHVTVLSNSYFDGTFMSAAINSAFWLWLGISATTIITHDAFEQREMKLTAINVGNQFVTLMTMGLIIGFFK